MANIRDFDLPAGDQWSAWDALCWVTFRELRQPDFGCEFPRPECSRDWKHWPPEYLACVFQEIATGIPWMPVTDSLRLGPDNQRAWALQIIEDTGESAADLLKALTADIGSYSPNQERWKSAKLELNESARRGRLRVWAVKAHAPFKTDIDGLLERLSPLLFTDTRGVHEANWIEWIEGGLGFIDYRGPSYDGVFFDSVEVRSLWPATSHNAAAILNWMTEKAKLFVRQRGGKPMRDDLLRDCMRALGIQNRAAQAAYAKLPDHLRRPWGRPGSLVKSNG